MRVDNVTPVTYDRYEVDFDAEEYRAVIGALLRGATSLESAGFPSAARLSREFANALQDARSGGGK